MKGNSPVWLGLGRNLAVGSAASIQKRAANGKRRDVTLSMGVAGDAAFFVIVREMADRGGYLRTWTLTNITVNKYSTYIFIEIQMLCDCMTIQLSNNSDSCCEVQCTLLKRVPIYYNNNGCKKPSREEDLTIVKLEMG